MASESNPWLSIPASDYEAHMGAPAVGQLQFLSRVFRELLDEFQPRDIVVLGCATGNGFEHVQPERVRRVVGIDLNPEYLDILKNRFGARIPGLELICSDIASTELEPASFDFVCAGLVLEYVDSAVVVERAARWLKRGGVFAAVLQLPGDSCGKVSETGIASMKLLEPVMHLVAPDRLGMIVERQGFSAIWARTVVLESGKQFFVGVYGLAAPRAGQ